MIINLNVEEITKVTLSSHAYSYQINLTIDADPNMLFDAIKESIDRTNLLEEVKIKEFVNACDMDDLLDAIGIDACMDHFNLTRDG